MGRESSRICRSCKKEGAVVVFGVAGRVCVECIVKRVEKGIEERLKNDYNKEVEDVREDV